MPCIFGADLTATIIRLASLARGAIFAGGILLLASVQLVERRGRGTPLGSNRQVELSSLLESIPDAVFLFDNNGQIVDLNQVAEQLCDRLRDQLRGTSIAGLNRLLRTRDDQGRPVETNGLGVDRALGGELLRDVRRDMQHPADGRVIKAIASASPLREDTGKVSGALLMLRDATEVAELQRRLTDSQRHKEVGEMAAGLAHDFNNVLEMLLNSVELLDMHQGSSVDERRPYIQTIRKAVGRGAEIVERVRDYLRSGSEVQTPVDLRRILEEVIDLTHPLWMRRPNVEMSSDLGPVPPVSGNAADLRRVFVNLIINALEAMPQGGKLRVGCGADDNHVRATVSDTGTGISTEQQRHLFVPYFTTKPQGTGLGLSGAHRIISAMHGHIQFRSEPGKGTTFLVDFPAAPAVEPGSAAGQQQPKNALQ